MLLAQCTALAASPAAASLAASPAPAPERAHTRTYLALDERNVADAGGAELVLGPVTKTHSALIAEEEPWEMRFDNMQPNVWYDDGKWRAWYSTFSTCDGRMPGPNHNASDEPDCQALQSSCNLTAPKPKPKPPPPPDLAAAAPPPPKVKKGRNGLFLYAESAEATPSRPFVKPALGLFPWPPQSSNASNNIFLNLGDCAGGGCGTGITLDHDSPTANFSRFKWFGSGSVRAIAVSHNCARQSDLLTREGHTERAERAPDAGRELHALQPILPQLPQLHLPGAPRPPRHAQERGEIRWR